MKKITKTAKQTEALGKKFVASLKQGGAFGLIGELGAGKTAFIKGVAKALGIKSTITSPTFVLMKVYKTKNKQIKHLVHVDAYRIKKAAHLSGIGLEDYIIDPEALVLIEWADKVKSLIKTKKNIINFSHAKLGRAIKSSFDF
ncbi:MAG: tRNA (adenosine(37)-N6)-threonylcarbamoyltransferase complex ATPase subunit type 1 TsaE [Candidatus Falkowbacteria bacterium]|nr:tRNA (adenosine(37)-N6)-threonylcarbamoyltransferase complex ATPase subunit type 1 TsaE [Candidatus Falkowbacteria bacterium]